jgi:hypothetical protein
MKHEEYKDVIRYVVTYVNRDGMRTLVGAAQGRNTYDTAEQAQKWIDAARKNNSASTLAMFGVPDTLEVRSCLCYHHGDPKGIWFD